MYRSNFAIIPTTLIAAAALLVGCDLEQSGEPTEAQMQSFELVEIGDKGEGCFVMDDAGTVECFQTEAEADEAILASLAEEESAPGLQHGAPNCVHMSLNDSGWTDYLRVTNTCSYTVRVKVVLAHATDKPCYTISPGSSRNYSWGYPGRFDGLVTC